MYMEDGITEIYKQTLEGGTSYLDSLPIIDAVGDGIPYPEVNGVLRYIEAPIRDLTNVKFKITGVGAPAIRVSLIDNYSLSSQADSEWFIVGDISTGVKIPIYFWANSGAEIPLGEVTFQIKDFIYVTDEA